MYISVNFKIKPRLEEPKKDKAEEKEVDQKSVQAQMDMSQLQFQPRVLKVPKNCVLSPKVLLNKVNSNLDYSKLEYSASQATSPKVVTLPKLRKIKPNHAVYNSLDIASESKLHDKSGMLKQPSNLYEKSLELQKLAALSSLRVNEVRYNPQFDVVSNRINIEKKSYREKKIWNKNHEQPSFQEIDFLKIPNNIVKQKRDQIPQYNKRQVFGDPSKTKKSAQKLEAITATPSNEVGEQLKIKNSMFPSHRHPLIKPSKKNDTNPQVFDSVLLGSKNSWNLPPLRTDLLSSSLNHESSVHSLLEYHQQPITNKVALNPQSK